MVAATMVGLMLGAVAAAFAGATSEAIAHGTAEFDGLGQAIAGMFVCVPLFLVVTAILFWKLPVRLGVLAAGLALYTGLATSRALLDVGAHWPRVSGPVNPVAMGLAFGLVTWLFLPDRSPAVAITVLLAVFAACSLTPKVRIARQRSHAEQAIEAAGVPIATTEIPGYHLQHAWGQPAIDSDPHPLRLSLTFRADASHGSTDPTPGIQVETYARPRLFDPPRGCDPRSDPDAGRFPLELTCTAVSPGLWWAPRSGEVIVEFHGALVVIGSDSLVAQPEAVLVDAARHLRTTTAHELVSGSAYP